MSKHIVIIGAGVIGLCCAYYAARRGHRVTVFDRNPEQRDGCSFGNAGMIVPSHFVPLAAPGMVALGLKWMWNPESPFYIKPRLNWDLLSWGWQCWRTANARQVERAAPLLRDLSFASRACFEELADGAPASGPAIGDFGLVKRGLLMLCKTPYTLDEEAKSAARANELGVPAEVLDAKQTAALDPAITMDIAGAVYFPKDAHLFPNRFMAALKARCAEMGVKFIWSANISAFTHHSSLITTTRTGANEWEADEFVLAGGSWSPALARALGLRIPMQAGKGYSLTLPNPPQLPQLCSILTEARVAVTPMGGALRIGGTMEIAGLNEDINPVRVRGIIKSALKYFPAFKETDFNGVQPWRGLRPCSPDGLPYLGRTAKFKNLTLATGHAMMGLSLGPITGRLVAELLSDERPSFDLALLNPDRYA
jgi:D-amino-acid dehydrogenase